MIAFALAKIGPEAKGAMPALIGTLTGSSPQLRVRAAYAISRIKPEGKEAIPILIKALNGKNYNDQCLAAHGLVAFDYFAPGEVPKIISALCSTSQETGYTRADWNVMNKFQPDKKSITAYLLKASKNKDKAIQAAATEALKKWEKYTPWPWE